MLEHGLDEVHAEELKGRILQYMTDTVLPSLVAEEENAIAKEPVVSAEDDNLFDQFGSALLEGCADLDLDKVCRNTFSLNYCTYIVNYCILPINKRGHYNSLKILLS